MEKAITEVKSPMERINTSSWGMNGTEIREHRNIAYLNNTILELTERIHELEKIVHTLLKASVARIPSTEE